MHVFSGNWKYVFKNLWYVILFAVVPAVFLALSFSYAEIYTCVNGLLTGKPVGDFITLFRLWSPVRVDCALGAIYSVFAYLLTVVFSALLMACVEKHMRIGKRTFNGIGSVFTRMLLPTAFIILLFYALGVLASLILSALIFAVASAIPSAAVVTVISIFAIIVIGFLLFYVMEVFFLWLPCMQVTGLPFYQSFLYSYRLVTGVRWKLMLAHVISFLILVVAMGAACYLPEIIFRVIAFALCLFLFLAFFVRMEVVYFYADKIDREDEIRSYREL